jgi:hypothetical protein
MVSSAPLGISLLPAQARIAIAQLAFDPPVAVPSPSPSTSPSEAPTEEPQTPGPTPTPVPTREPRASGGPLRFSLIGDVSFGETSTQSSFGAGGFFNTPTPSPGATPTLSPVLAPPQASASQSQTLLGAGAVAELSRRSSRTFLDLRLPLAISSTGRSTIGVASLLYSTPLYSLGYGPQLINALGLLQLGTTERGLELIFPVREGQVTFYEGPTLGTNDETLNVRGALLEQVRGQTFFESGLTYARGEDTGTLASLLFGIATVHHYTAVTGEAAYQVHGGGEGDEGHGLAAQLRLDDDVLSGGCSTSLRSLPNNFVILGGGEVPSDRLLDINCHTTKTPVYTDISWERTGSSLDGYSNQKLFSIGYSPSLRFGGFSINYAREIGDSVGIPISSTSVAASLAGQIGQAGALIGAQEQQSLSGGLTSDTRSLLASLHRQFGKYNFSLNGQVQTQTQQGVEEVPAGETPPPFQITSGVQRGIGFSLSRNFRRMNVQFGETVTRTVNSTSDAVQRTPLANLSYQLSPAIAAQASLGYTSLTDAYNPSANGKTRVFAISLSAPIGFGNGLVTGRVDPNLPATVTGRVVIGALNSGVGPTLNIGTLASNGGIGNVVVTLDGTTSQRTDLTGGFQFGFVAPGNHTISISTASIPAGFTATSPVQAFEVKGGQQAQVIFQVSTLGGVIGHVYGSQSGGVPIPLAGVRLQADTGGYALTDAGGEFGFGGLTPGVHTITIIPQTIPATANFAEEDLKGKVTVSNGSYATLDFHAQVLGSIAGQILYATDMSAEERGGVPNAYVVAEPGEHAAIDDDDGSFVIDNLPAGDYTISVDPETIDEALGASPDSVTVHLGPGEHYKGIVFRVGHLEKKVVFTLLNNSATPPPLVPVLRLSEGRLPPHGSTDVTISAPADTQDVSVTAFDKRTPLNYDKTRSLWVGSVYVPTTAKAGTYTVTGTAGKNTPKSASIVVDPTLPLVLVDYTPKNAGEGTEVTVRARFLVEVHPGERITWQDGDVTVLGKPLAGRVYSFKKRLTLLPLHGLLLTPQGPVPIELL